MKLRDYQKKLLYEIRENDSKKLCVQSATGSGKTLIFSEIALNYNGRVLILVDSKELVQQTASHIKGAGTFEAKDSEIPNDKIVICMAQTIKSRLKKHENLLDSFDLAIIDECHVLVYLKILKYLKQECKVIGFTATPSHNKKELFKFCFEHKTMNKNCCDSKKTEFIKGFRLGDIFDDIVVGIPIYELIEQNFLVKEENYVIPLDDKDFDLDKLGEVTQKSSDKVFDESYQMDVLGNYNEHCKGKKTMIFTQNTTLNKLLYDQFINDGVENCFMYDSVNDTEYTRSEVVEKFRDTPGAILFNVSCYVKGFDVTDVEAIIVSRRISSLSLFIQIVGRGSRPTTKIYKDKFIVIDGGTNIERLGRWSDDFDWKKKFKSLEEYKPKKEPPEEDPNECEGCGEFMPPKQCTCNNCDFNNCKKTEEEIIFALGIPLNIVYPDGSKIIRYCENLNKDKFFALKILTNQIYKMFDKIDKEQYERNSPRGVDRVCKEYLKPNYLKIIRSELPSKSNRTYDNQKDKLLKKLNKRYGN